MRVCLECGTPKLPIIEYCNPCRRDTHTHEGEARRAICLDCRNYQNDQCGVNWTFYLREKHQRGIPAHRLGRAIMDRASVYAHECQEFEAKARDYKPSPNPLPLQDVIEIKLYDPSAFWLDPHRWDHVTDALKQVMGTKPKEPETLRVAAGIGLLFAGLAAALAVRR